jgi:hypothetical protein
MKLTMQHSALVHVPTTWLLALMVVDVVKLVGKIPVQYDGYGKKLLLYYIKFFCFGFYTFNLISNFTI